MDSTPSPAKVGILGGVEEDLGGSEGGAELASASHALGGSGSHGVQRSLDVVTQVEVESKV